jgi:hypothetical protein
VTVVADAGMISEANQVALQAAGLSYILGARIPHLPDVVREWRDKHPDEQIPDGLVLTQPWPATSSEKARGIPDRVIYYQFRHDRARRTPRGIDELRSRGRQITWVIRRGLAGRGRGSRREYQCAEPSDDVAVVGADVISTDLQAGS